MKVYYVCYRLGISTKWIVYSAMFDSLHELIDAIDSEIDRKSTFKQTGIGESVEWAVFSHTKFDTRNLLVQIWFGNEPDYYSKGTKLFTFTDESFWYDSQYHQGTL